MHHLGQTTWGHIWKHTMEKSETNLTNATPLMKNHNGRMLSNASWSSKRRIIRLTKCFIKMIKVLIKNTLLKICWGFLLGAIEILNLVIWIIIYFLICGNLYWKVKPCLNFSHLQVAFIHTELCIFFSLLRLRFCNFWAHTNWK